VQDFFSQFWIKSIGSLVAFELKLDLNRLKVVGIDNFTAKTLLLLRNIITFDESLIKYKYLIFT